MPAGLPGLQDHGAAYERSRASCALVKHASTAMATMGTRPNSFSVLGVQVDAVQIPDVIARMQMWIESGAHGKYIAATGMHGIMEAHHDPAFREILNSADLVIPDGTPLVRLARLKGLDLKRRVYGEDRRAARKASRFSASRNPHVS